VDYLLCGNLPYPAWKKHISVQNLSNRRIRRYLVCRLKRPEARDFSHVRFTDNNMSDFSINEMQEMQKAGKMRTEKQKTGIVWDSHRRTKVKNRKLRGKILSL